MHMKILGLVFYLFVLEGLDNKGTLAFHIKLLKNYYETNVSFTLYTRETINSGTILPLGDRDKLLASNFKGSLPTKIITHGFSDSDKIWWIRDMKQEILRREAANVITLDWSECARNIIYNEAIDCMKDAGYTAGRFLKFLQNVTNLDFKNVHFIGHSLGAHLFAFTAKVFPNPKTIGRITALDPAGPLFEHELESERLNDKAAILVDVIHTCGLFLGIKRPIGTIDFYPNGGLTQPDCEIFDLNCHHSKSYRYFLHTINNQLNDFVSKKCETLLDAQKGTCNGESALMGYNIQFRTPGIYYLQLKGY